MSGQLKKSIFFSKSFIILQTKIVKIIIPKDLLLTSLSKIKIKIETDEHD